MTDRPTTYRAEHTDAGIGFRTADGIDLTLRRSGPQDAPAVLFVHGHGVSSHMFDLSEIRNVTDVLADAGYESWLLDWRGSSRLPYNESGHRYTLDDVALYDLPAAVEQVRRRIGDRPLFVVAHCIGALAVASALTAGLLPGLAGVVAQGVFLTPKVRGASRARVLLGSELIGGRVSHLDSDFRKVGLWSKRTLLYAALSRKGDCPDPTCRMVHHGWGMGSKLFEHDHLDPRTHDRLADLFGAIPLSMLPHLRQMELARAVVRFNLDDERYAALPDNALDSAGRIDCPVLLLSGSRNEAWPGANKLCHEVLAEREPALDVRYREIPCYGHLDTFIGRGAAIDVFGHIADFLDEQCARGDAVGGSTGTA